MSAYPSPEQINLPAPDDPGPEQQYYVGWLVQHNRLWLFVLGLIALNAFLVAMLFLQTSRYKPTIRYVTLDGGYPVMWNDRGNIVIDSTEYVPARLRAVVTRFVENRYAYDWQNLQKINSALRLMSESAQVEERRKLSQLNLANNVVAVRLTAQLEIDYSAWSVIAQGGGRFEVRLKGLVKLNDALRNPDPNNPAVKPIEIVLVLQTVEATDVNPLGYTIVSTGRDIL